MSYRYLYTTLLALTVVFLTNSQLYAQVSDNGYPLEHIVDKPLETDNLISAFRQLGLTIDRFSYEIPVPHRLKLTLDFYNNGEFDATGFNPSALSMNIGKNEFSTFLIRRDDFMVVTVRNETASTSVGKNPIKGIASECMESVCFIKSRFRK